MIGVFAVFGYEVYFNEMALKPNLMPADLPAENWSRADCDEMIYPFGTATAEVSSLLNNIGAEYPEPLHFPPLVGISITVRATVREIAFQKRKLIWRQVPYGKGVIYARSEYSDFEDTLYAALKLTGNLREAVALAGKCCLSIPGKPIFTTVGVVAWAIQKKDLSLIRTTSAYDAILDIGEQMKRLNLTTEEKRDLIDLAGNIWPGLTREEATKLANIQKEAKKAAAPKPTSTYAQDGLNPDLVGWVKKKTPLRKRASPQPRKSKCPSPPTPTSKKSRPTPRSPAPVQKPSKPGSTRSKR